MAELLEEIMSDKTEQYLKDPHFHHSLKGCKIKMIKLRDTIKDGVRMDSGMYKVCLTHNVECSKTGWELGHYLGNDNKNEHHRFHFRKCKCGKVYDNKYGMCLHCLRKENPELYEKIQEEYRLKQARDGMVRKMKLYGIPEERWEEKLKDYFDNYYKKEVHAVFKLKDFWKK